MTEEKNSIEDLKEVIELYNDKCLITTEDDIKSIKILLNLIEKQYKEIEELKQEKEYLNCIIESDKDNYINKDKIKAKIEEVKDGTFDAKIVLQSLLEKE